MIDTQTDRPINRPSSRGMDPFDSVIQEKRDANRLQFERTVQNGENLNLLVFLLGFFTNGESNSLLQNEDAINGIADSFSIDREKFGNIIQNFTLGTVSAADSIQSVRKSVDISQIDLNRAEQIVSKYADSGNPLLEVIAEKESGGNYNRIYGAGHRTMPLTDMSINDVLTWQKQYTDDGSYSSAAGKYQIIRKTLSTLKDQMNLSGDEKFDEDMQDRMAMHLLEGRGYDDYKSGNITERDFMLNVSKEWAAAPMDETGRGFYDRDGVNKGLIEPATILVAMRHAKDIDTSKTELASQFDRAQDAKQPLEPGSTPNASIHFDGNGGVDQVALAAAAQNESNNTPESAPGMLAKL